MDQSSCCYAWRHRKQSVHGKTRLWLQNTNISQKQSELLRITGRGAYYRSIPIHRERNDLPSMFFNNSLTTGTKHGFFWASRPRRRHLKKWIQLWLFISGLNRFVFTQNPPLSWSWQDVWKLILNCNHFSIIRSHSTWRPHFSPTYPALLLNSTNP